MSATSTAAVGAAADRLLEAAQRGVPCAPVRDLIGPDDVIAAYSVQQRVVHSRVADGARIVGRKIGLTSPAVQAQLGVDRPDFGTLFDDMLLRHGDEVEMSRLLQPKVEAEIAFVLSHDLVAPEASAASVRHAVAYASPALEVVDSRIACWDITFGDTVADNASSGLFVLGPARRALDDFEPVEAEMAMTADGIHVSAGSGADCLGDPLNALAWLARTAVAVGEPLRAGEVVLSGALGPMVTVQPGMHVRAEISGLGTVAAQFGTGPM
jgi:2-keto-4-pentenoate hydratase